MLPAEMKKMHLSLPEDLHARLKREAKREGRPTTVLARAGLALSLVRCERERFANELRAHEETYGGSELDLDEGFERAGAECFARGRE